MDFTTANFLALLIATAIGYRLCAARFRPALLVAISYGYYCTWSRWAALLLFLVTVAAFLAAQAIDAKHGRNRRSTMIASLAGLLLLLVAFKAAPLAAAILSKPVWIPLGISYYIFKLVSYILDVYWEKIAAEKAFLPFAAYVAFFPQIVAGPIQRSESFLPQMHKSPPATWSNVMCGLQRVVIGILKKFLVADNLGILVNFIYSHIHAPGTPLIAGLYTYPLQIYADFSGLTDIAIGAAWMLGVQSPENFNQPFWAPNPSEFWRRWHITLTSLLTDYVFTPMRMAVRNFGNSGLVLSLFVTMTLIGLWHGFRWTYALFGMVHAAYLSIDALTSRARKRYSKAHPIAGRLSDWLGPAVTFNLVALAFVLFRADTASDALYMLGHIRIRPGALSADVYKLIDYQWRSILIGFGAFIVIEIADDLRRRLTRMETIGETPLLVRWTLYYATTVIFVVVFLILLGVQVNRSTFVYAMF